MRERVRRGEAEPFSVSAAVKMYTPPFFPITATPECASDTVVTARLSLRRSANVLRYYAAVCKAVTPVFTRRFFHSSNDFCRDLSTPSVFIMSLRRCIARLYPGVVLFLNRRACSALRQYMFTDGRHDILRFVVGILFIIKNTCVLTRCVQYVTEGPIVNVFLFIALARVPLKYDRIFGCIRRLRFKWRPLRLRT